MLELKRLTMLQNLGFVRENETLQGFIRIVDSLIQIEIALFLEGIAEFHQEFNVKLTVVHLSWDYWVLYLNSFS